MNAHIDFVENFVNGCIESGITKPKDIAVKAESRIAELDFQIKNLISLQSERNNLNKVLKHFNIKPKEVSNSKKNKAKIIVERPVIIDDEDAISDFEDKILSLFDNNEDVCLSPKQIVEHVIGVGENPSPVYLVLQKMQKENFIIRNEDRTFSLAC